MSPVSHSSGEREREREGGRKREGEREGGTEREREREGMINIKERKSKNKKQMLQ